MSDDAADRITFGDVLRVAEFRSLWMADAQSMAGDQLARVALSILVFERTNSAALTALTYALTFLPAIVGGALLSGLADRLPRRSVMIGCDVIRAVLLAAMAMPHLSLWAICVLLVASVLAGRPFSSAEQALLPDILEGDAYVVGSALRMMTNQTAQLAGFAVGGVVISVIGPRAGLAVDAATFALSALIITLTVRHRPAPAHNPEEDGTRPSTWRQLSAATRLIATDSRLRTLLALGWLAAFLVVPEGLAAPYAHQLSAGATAIGLLMAAGPAGGALGAYLFVRIPERRRVVLIGPLAAASGLALTGTILEPGLPASIALWGVSGLFAAYQVQAAASFVRAVPNRHRGQTVGLASSGLLAVQGLGVLLFGVAADQLGAADAIALAGAIALALAIPLGFAWQRARQPAAAEGAISARQPQPDIAAPSAARLRNNSDRIPERP